MSVILPTRDRAQTLPDAIESVLGSSYGELELIVVDDGSADGTSEVVSDLDDGRIVYVPVEAPEGAASARNRGVGIARGQWLAFQDSDCCWTSTHLEQLLAASMASPRHCAVAYGRVKHDDGRVVPGPCDEQTHGSLMSVLPRYNIVDLPASIVTADAVRTIGGFRADLPRLQDWDLYLRLAREHTFAFVDEVVVTSREGPNRISDDQTAYFAALESIMDDHRDLFARVPRIEVEYAARLLKHALRRREPQLAMRTLTRLARRPGALARALFDRASGSPNPTDRQRCGEVSAVRGG